MKAKDLRKYKDEFVKLYKEGYSLRKIAEMYGVTKASVTRYVKEECELRQRGLSEKDKQKAKELYLYGKTVNAIGEILGKPKSTIKSYLSKEFGVVTEGVKKYEHLANDMIKDYEQGMNATEISKKYGVSRQTVINYVYESHIDTRDYSQTSRKYSLNEDYFDKLNEENSFILGIIFAKGRLNSTTGTKWLDITVYKDRIDVIETVLDVLYKDECPKLHAIENNFTVRINSEKLYNTLDSYHIYNKGNKEELVLPNGISEKEFWRGFIYSGISISKRQLSITGNAREIILLSDYLIKLGISFRSYSTGIIIQNKKEVNKLIGIDGYGFIKQMIEKYISTLDNPNSTPWNQVLKNN